MPVSTGLTFEERSALRLLLDEEVRQLYGYARFLSDNDNPAGREQSAKLVRKAERLLNIIGKLRAMGVLL